MMLLLHSLDSIQIKASYKDGVEQASITDVRLSTAEEGGEGDLAMSVEECACPTPYTGTSCQECSKGHYRLAASLTSPLGACVACNCNAHSNECNVTTGVCYNCQHNTRGDHCELCASGFYGNATRGRVDDCLRCPCPYPTDDNSFAYACEVSSSMELINCSCNPGYIGKSCDACDIGYWGAPKTPGSKCKSCQCNDNNDLSNRDACSIMTGECHNCQQHTAGPHCERCEEWYWGDAIESKNCTECQCDRCGSAFCDPLSGTCTCQPGVTGTDCANCEVNKWGFGKCRGCIDCNCGAASITKQCNDTTGQCLCKEGAAGTYCDRCQDGYYNYTENGCTKCDCDDSLSIGTVCDVLSGQCQCAPGVTGKRCDTCMEAHLLIPTVGCRFCDECIHVLNSDLGELASTIDASLDGMDNVTHAAMLSKRLRYFDEMADVYQNRSDDIENVKNGGMNDVKNRYKEAHQLGLKAKNDGDKLLETGTQNQNKTRDMQNEIDNLEKKGRRSGNIAQDRVKELKLLTDALTSASTQNRERLTEEAKNWLATINDQSFENETETANNEVRQAFEEWDQSRTQLKEPMKMRQDNISCVQHILETMSCQLQWWNGNLTQTHPQIVKAKTIIGKLNDTIGDYKTRVNKINGTEMAKSVTIANENVAKARQVTADNLNQLDSQLNDASMKVTDNLAELSDVNKTLVSVDIGQLKDKALETDIYADQMKADARNHRDSFANFKADSTQAMAAANAYTNIKENIVNATEAVKTANKLMSDQNTDLVDLNAKLNETTTQGFKLARQATEQKKKLKNDIEGTQTRNENSLKNQRQQLDDLSKQVDSAREEIEKVTKSTMNKEASSITSNMGQQEEKANEHQEYMLGIKDKIKSLEKDFNHTDQVAHAATSAVKISNDSLVEVQQIIPRALELLNKLEEAEKAAGERLKRTGDKLIDLQNRIALARDTANRIAVAAQFRSTSSLKLRNPDRLRRSASYTHLQFFFNTNKADGLLLFLGNEKGTAQNTKMVPSDDFIAIEIEKSMPKVTMNLGDGPSSLTSTIPVADEKWHKLHLERIGKLVKLSVTSEGDTAPVTDTQSMTIDGQKQVLNLHQNVSSFYLGGVPNSFVMPPGMKMRHFVGTIEDVSFHNDPVGLWNFAEKGAIVDVIGAKARSALSAENTSNGVTLRNGYVSVKAKEWNARLKTFLSVKFRTHADDGLLLHLGKEEDYLLLEVANGKVVVEWNLGSGRSTVMSKQRNYNDGKWHNVVLQRDRNKVKIIVDGTDSANGKSDESSFELSAGSVFHIGGLPAYMPLNRATPAFVGCIEDLVVDGGRTINLNSEHDVQEARGVESACEDISVRTASSVDQTGDSIIVYRNIKLKPSTQISLRFKTTQASGLLFGIADATGNGKSILLILDDGQLTLMHRSPLDKKWQSLSLELSAASDANWHYVIVTIEPSRLRLDIDDSYSQSLVVNAASNFAPDTVMTLLSPSHLPSSIRSAVDVDGDLKACIADLIIGDSVMDLAEANSRVGVSLAGCALADPQPGKTSVKAENNGNKKSVESLKPVPTIAYTPKLANDSCMLPRVSIGDREDSRGWRVSGDVNTRLEFESAPAPFTITANFTLSFRATAANGVLMAAVGLDNGEYLLLYLHDGFVIFTFDLGSGPVRLQTQGTLIDHEFHTITFVKDNKRAYLTVDGNEKSTVTGESPDSENLLETQAPIYLAGLSPDARSMIRKKIPEIPSSYSGCIRDFKQNGEEFAPPSAKVGVESSCNVYTEPGLFFAYSTENTYAVIKEDFDLSKKFSFGFEIKPRTHTAILLSSYSKVDGEFLALQLVDGQIRFTVNSGAGGTQQLSTVLRTEKTICDGKWHDIKVAKVKNVMTLTVDGKSKPKIIPVGSDSSSEGASLYLGGVPIDDQHEGLVTTEPFVGCLRNMQVGLQRVARGRRHDSKVIILDKAGRVGEVDGTCPIN